MQITWDPAKNRANVRKHGVSFEEASELFMSGRDYLEIFDDAHSDGEDRFIAIGPLGRSLAVVVHSVRDDETIRIISARWATAAERALFLESAGGPHD